MARSDGLHFDMKPSSSYSAVEEIESDRGVSRLPVHHKIPAAGVASSNKLTRKSKWRNAEERPRKVVLLVPK